MSYLRNMAVAVLAMVSVLFAGHSMAATLTAGIYQLLDHPDGNLTGSQGPYGLRLDVIDPPNGAGPVFSTELNGASVFLTWDGGANASISGSVYNNATMELWQVSHVFTGVTAVAGPNGGFTADGGTLTVTDFDNNVTVYQSHIDTQGTGVAFLALGDDHRCQNHEPDCGPFVARGWLNATGTNDWLVQLTPVPFTCRATLVRHCSTGSVRSAQTQALKTPPQKKPAAAGFFVGDVFLAKHH